MIVPAGPSAGGLSASALGGIERDEFARFFFVTQGLIEFARRAGWAEARALNAERREDLFADEVFPCLAGARLGDRAGDNEAEIGIGELARFGGWRHRQIFARDRLALGLHPVRRLDRGHERRQLLVVGQRRQARGVTQELVMVTLR